MAAAFANTLFTQTASFAADGFGIDERGQGVGGVIVRLGVVIAIPFAMLADRRGRRQMIVITAWLAPLWCALGAIAPNFWVLVGTQTIGRPLGLGARAADRRRRRGGDAAQQPRLRAQRARARRRARRWRRGCRASPGRHRHRRLATGLPAVVDLAAAGVQLDAAPARDAPLRTAPRDRAATRPPPVHDHLRRGDQRQPVRRPGVVLPEPLPRRRARLHRRRHRPVHAVHRDAGIARADRRRPARRHGRPSRRAGDLHAASRRC